MVAWEPIISLIMDTLSILSHPAARFCGDWMTFLTAIVLWEYGAEKGEICR